jgi:ABC-type phosphate transport system substrate-binding protein
MRSAIVRLLPVIAIVLAWSGRSIAMDDGFKIIVNANNPATTIEREFLRDAFLKKTEEWPNGETIHPVDLASRFPAHDRFSRDVLHKSPSQLKSYWNQQIFSGKGVPPPEADTVAAAVAFVVANPGAVGYVPMDADVGAAKVVRVR